MAEIEIYPPRPVKIMITISVMLATVMQVLDTTIANVALPHMQGTLSATQDQITWVLTSYIVAAAIMTLPIGWLSGQFGRKKIFLLSIAGFTVASMLCGIASSITEMVIFRVLQGVFGAALVPVSQAILLDINRKEERAAAMALWGVGIMIGPILGPTLGGYLTEYYNWRWVFFINLPVGILSFIGLSASLTETEPHDRPFDVFGFLSLSASIGALQLMLDRGELLDWFSSAEIIIYACIIAASFWMFVVHSMYAKHPFISLELFADRNFVAGLVFIFCIGIVLLATLALLPPFMQNLMGYPVLDIGLLMAPRGMGTMLAMMIVGKLSNKVDMRYLIFVGLSCTAFSLWEMSTFNTFVPAHIIISNAVIQGFGLGFVFMPVSNIAFATMEAKLRTEAAGLFSLLRNLGSSVGVSIIIALLTQSVQRNHAYLTENITNYNIGYLQLWLGRVIGSGKAVPSMLDLEINKQAQTIAYINDFAILMWITLAMIPLILVLKSPDRQKSVPKMMAE